MADILLNKFLSDFHSAVEDLITTLSKQFALSLEADEDNAVRPIDYLPEGVAEFFNDSINSLFHQAHSLVEEARENYRRRGSEIAKCYLQDLIHQMRLGIDTLNYNYSSVDDSFLSELENEKKDSGPYIAIPILMVDRPFSIKEMAVQLNSLYYNFQLVVEEELPFITLDKPREQPKKEGGPTQRQRALILHFKESSAKKYFTRQELKEIDKGSLALYNIVCEVRKGKYSLDDLEAVIEHLTNFPAAHKLAREAFDKKSQPLT